MQGSGHRQIDHTADLALRLWGPTEVEVLCEAMRAVVEILTEQAEIRPVDARAVEVDALDPEDRLVRWINEILYLATVEGFVAAQAEIELLPEGLRAVLRGEAGAKDRIVTEIKSATYHDLQLRQEGSQVVAQVVMDV
jgi:SHS2 domain-containing protein